MRKIVLVSVVLLSLIFTSCSSVPSKNTSINPQTIGGYWIVIDTYGNIYENCICVYWSTKNDTAIFDYDGTILSLNSNVIAVKKLQ